MYDLTVRCECMCVSLGPMSRVGSLFSNVGPMARVMTVLFNFMKIMVVYDSRYEVFASPVCIVASELLDAGDPNT